MQEARHEPALAVIPVFIPLYYYFLWSNLCVFYLCYQNHTRIYVKKDSILGGYSIMSICKHSSQTKLPSSRPFLLINRNDQLITLPHRIYSRCLSNNYQTLHQNHLSSHVGSKYSWGLFLLCIRIFCSILSHEK